MVPRPKNKNVIGIKWVLKNKMDEEGIAMLAHFGEEARKQEGRAAEEENKLEYTTIHKEYEAFVEKELKGKIGEKKLNKIKGGMADYVNETKEKQ